MNLLSDKLNIQYIEKKLRKNKNYINTVNKNNESLLMLACRISFRKWM